MAERQKKTAAETKGTASYIAPPVQRAVKLLRHIADGDPVSSMSDTAKALKINRTTLLRLLHTLEAEGFIERRADEAGYQVGLALITMSARIVHSQDLLNAAVPVVLRLANSTGMSSHLGILSGTDVLYLLRRTPNAPLTSNVSIGTRLPAHASSMGRVLLAYLDPPEVDALFRGKPLARFGDVAPTTMADLHAALKPVRAAGFTWGEGMFERGIGAAAVPIFQFDGAPVAALNVSGPLDAFKDKANRQRIESALRAAGRELSQRLGWIDPIAEPARPKPARRARQAAG